MVMKSRKGVARYQRDESGCMRGLISIFDFRNGRSSQKLLTDNNRGSKQLNGAASAKFESMTDICGICNDINGSVQCETSTSDTGKLSMKELIEEEMLGDQDQKKEENITNGESKTDKAGATAHIKKNRRWMRNKMSLDLDMGGSIAAENLVAGKSSYKRHKSCVIKEDICRKIHQDTTCPKHGQDGEPTEDPSAIELDHLLWESTKVLMNHFSDGNRCSKDGRVQPSKELANAIQVLNSNKYFFLKLLQDPNSHLVKYIQSSQGVQLEEEKFKVPTRSDIFGQYMGDAKKRGFFRRRFKGLERNPFKNIDSSEGIRKIVVLKPGTRCSGNANMVTPCSSLTKYPQATLDNALIKKAVSPYSFAEIKRKLKQAMRKEQHALSRQSSDEQLNRANRDKKINAESIGMVFPSRDHIFIDRIPKTSVGIKTRKLKGDSALTPEKRVSNIYIEAKKHLAQIVQNRDIDKVHDDNTSKRRPRSLGRILSYSGHNSPICSPRTEGEMRLTPNEECQSQTSDQKTMTQVTLARNISPSAQVKQESEITTCLVSDKHILEDEVPVKQESEISSSISDELPHDTNGDKPILEIEIPTSEDAPRFSKEESQKVSELIESHSIKFSPECITKSELIGSPLTCSEESLYPTSFKEETCEENEPSSLAAYKETEDFEDLCTISIATSRPSPISVLDPVIQEDDIGPPGMKYWNVIQPIRPQQVRIGEEISTLVEKISSNRICVDDKFTIKFVKDVIQMSGLTWDEVLRRFLLADHIVDPSLIDEVDFLPDLLSCDFNNLFDLISEVLIEIFRINFGCIFSLATPYVHPKSKGKDIFAEVWKRVDWFLKLESPTQTLDQIIVKDLTKTEKWLNLQLDCQNIGTQIQEAIFEDLVEETILSFCAKESEINFSVSLSGEVKERDVGIEA